MPSLTSSGCPVTQRARPEARIEAALTQIVDHGCPQTTAFGQLTCDSKSV
jgi:hypothetical protein